MANPFSSLVFRTRFFGTIFLIALALIAYGLFFKKPTFLPYEMIKVKRGEILQEVYVTGRIKTPETFNLAFEKSGKIVKVYSKLGDLVSVGKILVELDSSELYAQLEQEQANLEAQKAKLNELLSGTRKEEIAIAETKLQNVSISLIEARQNFNDELVRSYVVADDAIRSKADGLFLNPRGANPQLNVNINDTNLKFSIETQRKNIETILNSWQESLYDVKTTKNYLEIIRKFFDDLALITSQLTPSGNLTQTAIDGYKNNVSAARSAISSAISSINQAQEKLQNTQSALDIAQKELDLKKSGATKEQIETQESFIKQAQAKISFIQAQIKKNILQSPINGIISKHDAKVGEIAQANKNLISILPKSTLEIEANIPEVDIGKISLGNPVKITIDAYPKEIFEGIVSYIEPAETIIDGVVNYKTIISFKQINQKLKSGLTANLSIETFRKKDVLTIPNSAYIEKEDGVYIKKLIGKALVEHKIEIGLKGQNGLTEILSGLNDGDEIINIGLKQNNQ